MTKSALLDALLIDGLPLALSETQYMWTKAGVLIFFFLFFLGVLVRVLSRSEKSYEADARIVLEDAPVDPIVNPNQNRS